MSYTKNHSAWADFPDVSTPVTAAALDNIESGIYEMFRGWFSVRNYGATGDGVTDDTSALTAALAAATGYKLVIPPGTYVFTSQLTIPDNTHVHLMAGAQLLCKITTGVDAIRVGNASPFTGEGKGSGQGIWQIELHSTANVNDIIVNRYQDTYFQEYFYVDGLNIHAQASSTATGAGIHASAIYVNSGIRNVVVVCNNIITYGFKFSGVAGVQLMNPPYLKDCWTVGSKQHGVYLLDDASPSGTAQLWIENLTAENQGSGYHAVMIQGYSYGGWKSVVIRGLHHEHHDVVAASSFAICVDSPDIGLIIEDVMLAGANITNKGGIWIKSSTNPRNIKIKNVYNDGDWTPVLKDDFNSVSITSRLDRVDEYSVIPRVHAYSSTAQALTSATWTPINLDAEYYDTEAMHDNSTNPSRITIVTPGYYHITGKITYASNATGLRYAALRTDGATYIADHHVAALTGDTTTVRVVHDYFLAAGTYIELMGFQSSGGVLNSLSADGAPSLSLFKLG